MTDGRLLAVVSGEKAFVIFALTLVTPPIVCFFPELDTVSLFVFAGPGCCELLRHCDATHKVPTIDSLSMVHFKCLYMFALRQVEHL